MDFGQLALGVIQATVPFLLAKGAGKLVEKTAEEGFEHRGALLEKIKTLFKGEELITLNLFEKYPENADLQTEVSNTLSDHLEKSQDLARDFVKALASIEADSHPKNSSKVTNGEC